MSCSTKTLKVFSLIWDVIYAKSIIGPRSQALASGDRQLTDISAKAANVPTPPRRFALRQLLGFVVIGIGVYIILKFEHFTTAAFVIIGLGLIVLLNAGFGSLGAARESSRLSKTFAAILVILVVLQVLVVGFFWIFKSSLLINVDKTFDQLWQGQTVPIKPGNASQIASLERWLECCGNVGPNDYILPPYSCYNVADKLNLDGCRQKFLDYISDRWTAFNIFAIVLVLVELICAAFAYVLANSILNRWRRSKYYPK